MSNPLFPNHKPEDADLSKVEGYTGHPGQDRVNPDLKSQHEHSAQGYADKKKAEDAKVGGKEDVVRRSKKMDDEDLVLKQELEKLEAEEHKDKKHR